MKKNFRITAMLLSAVMSVTALSACGGSGEKAETQDTDKITWWLGLDGNVSQTASNLGDTPFAKKLMEATDTQIEFIHPAVGQETEKFNLLMAQSELPDIVQYAWTVNYPGGPEKALNDGIIQEIDLEKDAPNLAAYIKEHPELGKDIKTDSGKYFGFPFIRGDQMLLTSAGPILRQDWLDELNLQVPETIDEWTEVLRAFKEKKGASAPLSMNTSGISWGTFIGAYGVYDGLFVQDGKIVYGPAEDSYKDFLVQMNKWYEEGLLDPNYVNLDGATVQSNILNGVSGATFGSCGSGIGKWMAAATEEGYDLVGAKYPVLNKGEQPQFGSYEFPVTGQAIAVITRDCKDVAKAVKLLDYAYSEEGHMLYNFGIEGESYTDVDGYPTYTEKITSNPDGLSMTASLAQYALSCGKGPFVQDKRYMEQYASLPQQQSALTSWMDTNMKNHRIPNINLPVEKQSEIATTVENINTYKSEMQAKFIMGVEPISKFEDYKKQLTERGLDKYITYYQEAYDSYMSR